MNEKEKPHLALSALFFTILMAGFTFSLHGVQGQIWREVVLFSGENLDIPNLGYRYSGPYYINSGKYLAIEWEADRLVNVYILNEIDWRNRLLGFTLTSWRVSKTGQSGQLWYPIQYTDNYYIIVMTPTLGPARLYKWVEKLYWLEYNLTNITSIVTTTSPTTVITTVPTVTTYTVVTTPIYTTITTTLKTSFNTTKTYQWIPIKNLTAFIHPSIMRVEAPKRFNIEIKVDPKDFGISSGEMILRFNPSILQAIEISRGNLLGDNPLEGMRQIDNINGMIKYAIARVGPTPVPTPNGTFATITFEVKRGATPGYYKLELSIEFANENYEKIINIEVRGGEVYVIAGILGDINGDGTVNYMDLAILGSCYGKSRGEGGYRQEADLNNDGIIDYRDLAILGANYGRSS
ncbi:MAG: dockerin type I domain-containing protein [Nitrososphaerota archaeon]